MKAAWFHLTSEHCPTAFEDQVSDAVEAQWTKKYRKLIICISAGYFKILRQLKQRCDWTSALCSLLFGGWIFFFFFWKLWHPLQISIFLAWSWWLCCWSSHCLSRSTLCIIPETLRKRKALLLVSGNSLHLSNQKVASIFAFYLLQ